ncbi:hypothetical protein EZS27_015328 [termite gut metagenome]|uniref:Type I restriction modification DNA specificity domain-containing protein n=1 Tax=termite gut metagenome TaxID=433724 RepID=A0A5J4RST0_9ZZZZ
MPSNYKPIGDYIRLVDERNKDLEVETLLGLTISKQFIPSVANIIGTDMANYKIIRKNQFACSTMQVRRDKKMPVALLQEMDEAIISQAYPVFEINDTKILLPEYLMMWFTRAEFDREACFYAIGGVRGSLEWEDFCNMQLPIPTIDKQKEIVAEYNIIQNHIVLNNQLIQKLEETAQTIYKQWFVDFEFPDENGKGYKSNGGEMVESEMGEVPKGWKVGRIGDYAKVKSGFAFKSEWWQSNGVPVIKIGSIQNNTIDYSTIDYISEENSTAVSNYAATVGNIVIAMTGATLGKIAIVPDIFEKTFINQRVGLFETGYKQIEKAAFLYYSLRRDEFYNEITNVGGDSAQANVSNVNIENIKLLMPDSILLDKFNHWGKQSLVHILDKVKEIHYLEKLKELLLAKMAK